MSEKKRWTEQDVLKILSLIKMTDIVSLDAEVPMEHDHEGHCHLGDIIQDDGPTPDDIILLEDRKIRIKKYISKLSPREQTIISMRYGLDDGNVKTLDEIGQKYGVTREYIRQVELRALKKLRHLIVKKDGICKFEDF